MKQRTFVGIDLGGTKIHSALVVGDKVVKDYKRATPRTTKQSEIVAALIEVVQKVSDGNVEGIGIGVPGVIDVEAGIVRNAANLPVLNNMNLRQILEKEFNIPVYMNNDANCFVAGEKHFGLGQQFEDIVGLTLGTGIGGGVVINGKLHSGRNCGAGEFCSIKYKGHNLEHYCSSIFFEKEHNTTALDLFNAAIEGDEKSIRILREFGTNVGEAIYTIVLAYDPELIVLGGSIARARTWFEEAMHEVLQTFPNQHIIDNLEIAFSEEPNAAVLGAAALCLNR
ncbi:MAG: ROK family protein [Bacteroidota bacterium]